MRRKAILIMIAVFALVGVSFAAYGFEKSEFVTKCMANGRDYKPCACTYNALPDLPDAYADLAVSWAHESPSDYRSTYVKTLVMDLIPAGGGRKTSYGRTPAPGETSYFGQLIKSVGTSVAVKWIVSLLPGVDGGTSLVVTTATKATGKFGYARYVFDQHCGKRLETMANEMSRYTSVAGDAAKKAMNAARSGLAQAAKDLAASTSKATKSTIDLLGKTIGLEKN